MPKLQEIQNLRSGATAGHIAGVHRLARLLDHIADAAKAVHEGEDEAALGTLDDIIEWGAKIGHDLASKASKTEKASA